MSIKDYDTTAANNTSIDGISIQGTANVSNFDNAFRQIMADIATWQNADTLASAATTDLSTVDAQCVSITGTATISSFGTLKAGMIKFLRFVSTPTITYNATSMIVPGATTISVTAGDTAIFQSLGSGNWRCLVYERYAMVDRRSDLGMGSATDSSGAAALPAYSFSGDPDTGMYRVGANQVGFSTAGTLRVTVDSAGVTSTVPLLAPSATSAGAPDYAFALDTDSGMYRVGANALGFSTAATQRLQIDQNAAAWTIPQRTGDGLVSTPSYSFTSDTNTGMYLVSADSLGLSAGGTLYLTINSTASQFTNDVRVGTFSTTGASVGGNISTSTLYVSSVAATAASNQMRFYNPNGQVGSIQTSGTTTSFNTTSDGRLKTNRAPLSEEVDVGAILDSLEPVAFDWLSQVDKQPTGDRGHGFIAQDLHKIVPPAVSVGGGTLGRDNFSPWAVDMSKLVPYLVAEIKSLRKRMADLEKSA
jgi:hypothetical protein